MDEDALLAVKALHIRHGEHTMLDIAHWHMAEGQLTAIVGPNGAGKSTFLNALAGGSRHDAHIHHRGQALQHFNARQLAMHRAVLGQHPALVFPCTVADLLRLGREAWRGSAAQAHDDAVCTWALAAFDLTALAGRNCQQLSGGEQHRAHLARVLAQLLPSVNADLGGKWLLLDEPTNHLDIAHQYRLFALLAQLQARGLSTVAILHDPALAINHADRLLLLKGGRIHAEHTTRDGAVGSALDSLYGIAMNCRCCPHSGRFYFSPQLPSDEE